MQKKNLQSTSEYAHAQGALLPACSILERIVNSRLVAVSGADRGRDTHIPHGATRLRNKYTHTHRQTQTDTDRHTDTQTHRHTDTQTHRHTDTQTHRHTDTQTHRHTDTHAWVGGSTRTVGFLVLLARLCCAKLQMQCNLPALKFKPSRHGLDDPSSTCVPQVQEFLNPRVFGIPQPWCPGVLLPNDTLNLQASCRNLQP